jgi:hypothetical protein
MDRTRNRTPTGPLTTLSFKGRHLDESVGSGQLTHPSNHGGLPNARNGPPGQVNIKHAVPEFIEADVILKPIPMGCNRNLIRDSHAGPEIRAIETVRIIRLKPPSGARTRIAPDPNVIALPRPIRCLAQCWPLVSLHATELATHTMRIRD